MAAIQRGLFRRLGRRRNRLEYLLPDAPLAPAGKAIVDRLVGTVPGDGGDEKGRWRRR
jgi:hypothetical protein